MRIEMNKKSLVFLLIFPVIAMFLNGCGQLGKGSGLSGGACYWKNNVRYNLPSKVSQLGSKTAISKKRAFSQEVLDFNADVYLAGGDNIGAFYWRNGDIVYLNGGSTATDIFVEGTDIYVSGDYMTEDLVTHACYWKNGQRVDLDGISASSIFVKDSVPYLAGTYAENGVQHACYWVNDQKVERVTLDGLLAYNIFVDNSGVYLAGFFTPDGEVYGHEKGCYWKNRIRTRLDNIVGSIVAKDSNIYVSGGDEKATARSVCIEGSDLYFAGSCEREIGEKRYRPSPCYWKNGKLITIETSVYPDGEARDICVSGQDIFIIGSWYDLDIRFSGTDGLWYNGQFIPLYNTILHSVFVKRP
jgi:hypothetical protein